jgi:hypothetical protein
MKRLAMALLALPLLVPAHARAEQDMPAGATALLDRLQAAWQARSTADYLALWTGASDDVLRSENEFAMSRFSSEKTQIFPRGIMPGSTTRRIRVSAQTFSVSEPRAALEDWVLILEPRGSGWVLVGREPMGRLDGLVHLTLFQAGFRADGMSVRFEDFDLQMSHGTLFLPPDVVGPTVLVFVGEGTIHFKPAPLTEQEQLRQYSGKRELTTRVQSAFLRIHPADLHRILSPVRLERDPRAASRWGTAQRLFQEQVGRSFLLDGPLPGAPWSLLPSVGDSLITFSTGHDTLTFAVNSGDPESLTLFDRAHRRQICLYPAAGRDVDYNEDDQRAVDVLHHDLRMRLDPGVGRIVAEDTLKMRLLGPTSTLRLHLNEGLQVQSVTSPQAGAHVFFRVRNQDSLLVALGPLSAEQEISLTVRYAGELQGAAIEDEVMQLPPGTGGISLSDEIPLEEVQVFTNREGWYPQAGTDDFAQATLRFDLPAGFTAVTGGKAQPPRVEAGRVIVEYHQDEPGKYISVAVGRLVETAARTEGSVQLRAFATVRTRSQAADNLRRAADILRFYATEFGPPPYTSLALVNVEGRTPGGHSPPGMVVLAQRPIFLRGQLREDPGSVSVDPDFFLAHELAHQWWGHGIAGQNYHERWLSEGFAQYAAALWLRHEEGEDAFRGTLRRMTRWALKFTKDGPISLGYRLGRLENDPQIYRAIVYDKAAYVLHMLRSIIGDEAFRGALVKLQQQHRFQKIGTRDLREALEAASGLDLKTYFEEWIFGTSLPTLRYSNHTAARGGKHLTEVTVEPQSLPGPVPLELAIDFDDGHERRRVRLEPAGGRWTVDTAAPPQKVEINGDYGLLARVERGGVRP